MLAAEETAPRVCQNEVIILIFIDIFTSREIKSSTSSIIVVTRIESLAGKLS